MWRGPTITLNNNTFTGNSSYGADIDAEEVTVLTLGGGSRWATAGTAVTSAAPSPGARR